MQAGGQVDVRKTRASDHIGIRKRRPAPDGKGKKAGGARRLGHAFLTKPILPLGQEKVHYKSQLADGAVNVVNKANYCYLRDSVARYVGLSKRRFTHKQGETYGTGIARLYDDLRRIVPPQVEINIEYNDGRLQFVLWSQSPFGDHSIYWLPMYFLDELSTTVKRVVLNFFQRLRQTTGMITTNNSEDVEMILEWIRESMYDMNEEDRQCDETLIEEYECGGEVHNKMCDIERPPEPMDLACELQKLRPRKEKIKKLVELLKEGLPFLSPDAPRLMDMAYDPYKDDRDTDSMYAEKLIRFIWHPNDRMTDELESHLNCEYESDVYMAIPATVLRLTPDTNEVFAKNTYPKELYAFLDKLIPLLQKF